MPQHIEDPKLKDYPHSNKHLERRPLTDYIEIPVGKGLYKKYFHRNFMPYLKRIRDEFEDIFFAISDDNQKIAIIELTIDDNDSDNFDDHIFTFTVLEEINMSDMSCKS